VTVAARTDRWILSRGLSQGHPTLLLLLTTWMPAWLGVLLVLYGDWIPCLRVLAAGMTDSRDFLTSVALGKIAVVKSTVANVSGSTVTFRDGTSGTFDAIVFATGYARDVPFMPKRLRPEATGLYKGVFAPSDPRVAYVLFVLPFGSHFQGAFYTLVPVRPRSRGERRSLRTFPGVSLLPPLGFDPRPRRLSSPTDAFQLHPDVRSYGTTLNPKSRSSKRGGSR
jgi:hypothetical protein